MKTSKKPAGKEQVEELLGTMSKEHWTAHLFSQLFAAQVNKGTVPSQEAIDELYDKASYAAGKLLGGA